MNKEEKQLSSRLVYQGKILDLRLDSVALPDGSEAKREYVCHNGGSAVLAVDNDENIYLVSQYRYAYREEILEIPAGKIEKGEDPSKTSIRELVEETGLIVDEVTPYGVIYPTPGYTNEKIYVYKAHVEHKGERHLDEGEFLDVIIMPLQEAYKKVLDGLIKDGKTVYAIMRYVAEKAKS